MFCTVSLPRKWSIRNTCDSSNTSCTDRLSATAESRSCPNGFSRTIRAPWFRPDSPRLVTMPADAAGGTAR